MKKFILIGIAAVSIMASADVNTKKILEEYRKEALKRETAPKPEKVIKKRINLDSVTGTSETAAEDENATVEVVEDGTQATPDIIEKVNLKKFMELHKDDELNPDEMSGGEKKRVSIARALFNNPEIIILDEPTSDLDPENKGIVNDIIFSLNDKTRLVVTHDWAEEYLKKFDKVVRL